MEKQTLLLDLDDTLVHCNKYFERVISQFADFMMKYFEEFGIRREEIIAIQSELDTQALASHGFIKEHFPESFIGTYLHFCRLSGKTPQKHEQDLLYELGWSVYEQEFEPFPGVEETLERLNEDGHNLFLYTGGDPDIQQRKINKWGLNRYFENRILIRRHKNTPTMENIIREFRFDRKRTWMVGNSLRTDILPALETGIHAVHIPAPCEWSYNIVDIPVESKGFFLTLSSLEELPHAVSRYTRQKKIL